MKKIILFLLCITLLNCFNKEKQNEVGVSNNTINSLNEYEQVSNKSIVKSNKIISIANFTNIELPLSLIFFKESEKAYLNINDDYFNVNWEYNIIDESISTNDILLFKNSSEYIILIPTYSEEFPTFQMIGVDEFNKFTDLGLHTFSSNVFENLRDISFKQLTYKIVKSSNRPMIKGKYEEKEILLSSFTPNENRIPISVEEKKEVNNLRSQDKNEQSNIKNIPLDLDLDGKKENYSIDFVNKTINSSSQISKDIFFENNLLIVKKEISDNNPHDLQYFKYYFQSSANTLLLNKVEYKREVYVETTDLCNFIYTYLPPTKISIFDVNFYNTSYLNNLIRKLNLKEVQELVLNTNKNYQCASILNINELAHTIAAIPLNEKNVNDYNNIAYYLEQNKQYETSYYLLDKIIKKYPNRVVAWLNLGDVNWKNNEKIKAKEAYQKYIAIMKFQNKDLSKIPQRVYERSK